jgi:two-component system sensor histidine kinase YesM
MLEYINNLINQVLAQKIMSQKAELKQLQSQIDPHFLYNSFFILQRMVQEGDNENAVKFCASLGRYFRYVTRNAQSEIALQKEVEHARHYLEIQTVRFPNIAISFGDLPVQYSMLLTPRLILQPIIENAFEHGLSKRSIQARIAISFTAADDGLRISVEDNGVEVDDAALEQIHQLLSDDGGVEIECTGLLNVHRRIQHLFGRNSGVTVSRGEMGGWKVSLFFEGG